jgi:hypothetical protein
VEDIGAHIGVGRNIGGAWGTFNCERRTNKYYKWWTGRANGGLRSALENKSATTPVTATTIAPRLRYGWSVASIATVYLRRGVIKDRPILSHKHVIHELLVMNPQGCMNDVEEAVMSTTVPTILRPLYEFHRGVTSPEFT